jgi:pilus assembly protein Flp/PilA
MAATVRNSRLEDFINLGDFASSARPYCLRHAHPDRRGSGSIKEQIEMLNLVEKYTAEAAAETEDGVVAIEYVIVAAALVVALAALWTAFGTALSNKLQAIVNSI